MKTDVLKLLKNNEFILTPWWVIHAFSRGFIINAIAFYVVHIYLTFGLPFELAFQYQYIDVVATISLIFGLIGYLSLLICGLCVKEEKNER